MVDSKRRGGAATAIAAAAPSNRSLHGDNNGRRRRSSSSSIIAAFVVSPRRRALLLQRFLTVGILGLGLSVGMNVLLYSRLAEFSDDHSNSDRNDDDGGLIVHFGRREGNLDLGRRGGGSGAAIAGRRGRHRDGNKNKNKNKNDGVDRKANAARGRGRGLGRGSERGRVECDRNVSSLVSYWNDPRSDADRAFRSPFLHPPPGAKKKEDDPEGGGGGGTSGGRNRYLSFEPDLGGWNNIRMSFEIMVVLASATGRTLVLPPDNPLYLLKKDRANRRRGVQDFFHGFEDVVETISTEEYFRREILTPEGKERYPPSADEGNWTRVLGSLRGCAWMKKADESCLTLYDYLSEAADLVPKWHAEHHCLVMDDENWHREEGDEAAIVAARRRHKRSVEKFCAGRKPVHYDRRVHDAPLLHFHSHHKDTRLLAHFYAFLHFTNPRIGNHYRRLVRDRARYGDEIFCAAGKIVESLVGESATSSDGGGVVAESAGYSAMHIRRGDFQWKEMRISSQEWYENTRSWLVPGELLYIATDETNKTWFEPLTKRYRVRFLDDYSATAGLSDLDPNYAGMIEQVVASRSRVFVGTYFSSFSAYAGRMRGYHGLSGRTMYYAQRKYWNVTHSWVYPHSSYSAREYPIAWVGIDGDVEPSEKDFY